MSIKFIDTSYRYGFHVSKEKSIEATINRIISTTPLSAMQIFLCNNRSKALPVVDYDDGLKARKLLKRYGELYLVIHGRYTYNLAGCVGGRCDEKFKSGLSYTIKSYTMELDYGVLLGAGVVIHPGASKDREDGLKVISESIAKCLTRTTDEIETIAELLGINVEKAKSQRKVILENAAGEGNKLCSTLEEIAQVITGVPEELRHQVKVCIDTAHAFGKGLYKWGKPGEIDRFYDDFDRIIGLEYLEVFHFNDSMISDDKRLNAPFGCCKDRHALLGTGYIFKGSKKHRQIAYFMEQAHKHGISVIGEPPEPGKFDWDRINTMLPLSRIE